MKISEIKLGISNVEITGKIIDISEHRDVNTRYGRKKVADAQIEDDSGQIKLSLWENQIETVKVGDKIHITGAYVTEFRDVLQLNIPKTGKLEIVKA